jgi:hypothetical protein
VGAAAAVTVMSEPIGQAEPVESGVVRMAATKVRVFYDRYAPWISLGLGVLARVYSRKGVDFAPKAVAIVALAWLLPAAVARWLRPPRDGGSESKLRHWARTASPVVTILLYKNVLFFLVPIYFGSAHLPSINIIVPLLLAAMALLTCFTRTYREEVLEHPGRRVLWTAVVLFAALVPATAVIAYTSPRTSIVISALVAAAVAWATEAPTTTLLSKRGLFSMLGFSLPVAGALGLAAPLFPPVPMVCHECGAGTAIVRRELVGRADVFPAGTARVYAWFAVTLPAHNRQEVVFQWFHEGKQIGQGLRTAVQGGRKQGFRTWTLRSRPAVGHWRVDMLTGRASQLIGRTRFEVRAPTP